MSGGICFHYIGCHAIINELSTAQQLPSGILLTSQCSTVVHNIVVRTTIKVNGTPQILGTRSPQTPESIDLKFDLDDYVGGLTLRAKSGTNWPGGAKG